MVIALAGRRIDAPDAATPNFPVENIQKVKDELRRFFTLNHASALVCSAACGADLAALEVAGELGMHRVVLLPFLPGIFKETSVTDRGGNWGEVYDKLMNEVEPIVLNYDRNDNDAYTKTNLDILHYAELQAKGNEPVEALAVWNMKPRSAGDATQHFMLQAKSRNIPVKEIGTLMTEKEFLAELRNKLKTFDRKGAEQVCARLIEHIYKPAEHFDKTSAGGIMSELRHKRMFSLMQKVGDAYIFTGKATWKIKKLYAQSLIDQEILGTARTFVTELIENTEKLPDDKEACAECMEARGLLGRIYKQKYVETPGISVFLLQAIEAYYNVYEKDREEYTWQGINAASLLVRAQNDGISVSGYPAPQALAGEILEVIEQKRADGNANAWHFATAAEACIILNRPTDVLEWISGYAASPHADAFELSSTLRQLKEVWKLDMSSEIGGLILPVLHAVLMTRDGGVVRPADGELKELAENLEGAYEQLVDRNTNNIRPDGHLEKVFGADTFSSVQSYRNGLHRCSLVGRISRRNRSIGQGTGFILPANLLNDAWGSELVLLTNAHVIGAGGALLPKDAEVIFEELNNNEKFELEKILWSSPYGNLDASVVTFTAGSLAKLTPLVTVPAYPIARDLPVPDEKNPPLIYVIGYPGGGFLQFSMKNNVLLDLEDPRIHYRTATMRGSSGSPAFNEDWELVGLHHAGLPDMPRLNGKPGNYEANEGIWIGAIKAGIKRQS